MRCCLFLVYISCLLWGLCHFGGGIIPAMFTVTVTLFFLQGSCSTSTHSRRSRSIIKTKKKASSHHYFLLMALFRVGLVTFGSGLLAMLWIGWASIAAVSYECYLDRKIEYGLCCSVVLKFDSGPRFLPITCSLLLVGIELNPGPFDDSGDIADAFLRTAIEPNSDFILYPDLDLTPPTPSQSVSVLDTTLDVESDFLPVGSLLQPLILSGNVNSLPDKFEQIQATTALHVPSAFALQETKLCNKLDSQLFAIPNYELFRKDRSKNGRSGGGVALYVHNGWKGELCRIRTKIGSFEYVAVKCKTRRKKLILCSIYRPPSLSVTDFKEEFPSLLCELQSHCPLVMICGDVNLHFHDSANSDFLEILQKMGLSQVIQDLTHRNKTLDWIMVPDGLSFMSTGTLSSIEKHHLLTYVQFRHLPQTSVEKRTVRVQHWSQFDWDKAKFQLLYKPSGEERDFAAEIRTISDCEEAVEFFVHELQKVQTDCLPTDEKKFHLKPCVWMTSELAKDIRKKNSMFRKWRTETELHIKQSLQAKWRALSKSVKFGCKQAKKVFLNDKLFACNNMQEFWIFVKKYLCMSKNSGTVAFLNSISGNLLVTNEEQTAGITEHFLNVFNHSEYVAETAKAEESVFEHSWLCTTELAIKYITELRSSAAVGFDSLSPRFVKGVKFQIGEAVSVLINKCMQDECFPRSFKHAKIFPVPKVTKPSSCVEFRPIALLSCMSKVFEKHLKSCLLPYVLWPLSNKQFGFRPGRGCEDALAVFQSYVSSAYFQAKHATKVACVSVDVSKAFDRVIFVKLLDKCRCIGMPEQLIGVLQSYLYDRTMTVVYNGESGQTKNVPSGVPQGSILGPLLYNFYANSILTLPLSENSRVLSYADDMLLLKPLFTDGDFADLCLDIEKIHAEYGSLGLNVNINKSSVLVCSISPQKQLLPQPIVIGQETLSAVDSFRYLGLTVDRKVNFDHHWTNRVLLARKLLNVLWYRYCKFVNREVFHRLYMAKILPVFLYGSGVVYPTTKKSIVNLEKLHRYAARVCTNDFLSPYSELLARLNWKSISELFFCRSMLNTYKYAHNLRFFPEELLKPVSVCTRSLRNNLVHEWQLELCRNVFNVQCVNSVIRSPSVPFCFVVKCWNFFSSDECELNFRQFRRFLYENNAYSVVCQRYKSFRGQNQTVYILEQLYLQM